jgi:hypothetical protein
MQTNTVGVEYRRKFNLGNYESLELSISLYAKVDPGEDPDAVAEFLWHQAKESVNTQAAPVLKSVNYKAQMQHKVGGLTVEDSDLKEF